MPSLPSGQLNPDDPIVMQADTPVTPTRPLTPRCERYNKLLTIRGVMPVDEGGRCRTFQLWACACPGQRLVEITATAAYQLDPWQRGERP
jgi:hypothetical protein